MVYSAYQVLTIASIIYYVLNRLVSEFVNKFCFIFSAILTISVLRFMYIFILSILLFI